MQRNIQLPAPGTLRKAWGWLTAWWKAQGERLILFVGMLIVGGLGYEAGWTAGVARSPSPVIIEKSVAAPALPQEQASPTTAQASQTAPAVAPATIQPAADCVFVGSKNSNKYHAPTSGCAKRIKPENKVCFGSVEIAKQKGYVAGCL